VLRGRVCRRLMLVVVVVVVLGDLHVSVGSIGSIVFPDAEMKVYHQRLFSACVIYASLPQLLQ
jgi:hypothetical protein